MDLMDYDRAYANTIFIPGGAEYPGRWLADAAAFRAVAPGQLDIPYGGGVRQRFDLFRPAGVARGLVVLIHGGYWLEGDRSGWSHFAAGVLAHGWAAAVPSYTLAPAARIGQIGAEIAQAITTAAGLVAGPIVVTGHSAGGQLAARMASATAPLPPAVAVRLRRVVPISPLADLAPIARTAMNADLKLDAAEIDRESPARLAVRPDTAVRIWVGGQERPAFLWQARLLSEAWSCPWHVEPGRHHFDVIDGLTQPDSSLVAALLA